MVQEMSDKELITITIDRYAELQRIKQSNGTQENKELDYSIKLTVAKLSSLGVNVEDITLQWPKLSLKSVKPVELSGALHFF